jgi:hypothetical protein
MVLLLKDTDKGIEKCKTTQNDHKEYYCKVDKDDQNESFLLSFLKRVFL